MKFNEYYNNLEQYTKDYFNILYKGIPIEAKPYVDIIMRLKDIDYFCGMKYASSHVYNFSYSFSRLDHSINCFLETLNFSNDFEMALSALYHDCNTPIFSHVVDYLYKDYINQEVSESKNEMFLLQNKDLNKLIDNDNYSIDNIVNPKQYSIVDNDRPKLCVDRLDGIFLTSLSWTKEINFQRISDLYNDVRVLTNEDGEKEIGFSNESNALDISHLELKINKFCHGKEDTYEMLLMADIIKYSIDKCYIAEMELYTLTEREFISILNKHMVDDFELFAMWEAFTKIEVLDNVEKIKTKMRYLNPLYNDGIVKRLR